MEDWIKLILLTPNFLDLHIQIIIGCQLPLPYILKPILPKFEHFVFPLQQCLDRFHWAGNVAIGAMPNNGRSGEGCLGMITKGRRRPFARGCRLVNQLLEVLVGVLTQVITDGVDSLALAQVTSMPISETSFPCYALPLFGDVISSKNAFLSCFGSSSVITVIRALIYI